MQKTIAIVTLILYSFYSIGILTISDNCGGYEQSAVHHSNQAGHHSASTDHHSEEVQHSPNLTAGASIGCCEGRMQMKMLTEAQIYPAINFLNSCAINYLPAFAFISNNDILLNKNYSIKYCYILVNPPPLISSIPLNVLNETFLI